MKNLGLCNSRDYDQTNLLKALAYTVAGYKKKNWLEVYLKYHNSINMVS